MNFFDAALNSYETLQDDRSLVCAKELITSLKNEVINLWTVKEDRNGLYLWNSERLEVNDNQEEILEYNGMKKQIVDLLQDCLHDVYELHGELYSPELHEQGIVIPKGELV